jgi:hypothetical protein
MVELQVVTAIADPEFEGLVASTLYAQGWSVLFRALDSHSLKRYLLENSEIKPLLLYSSDIAGIDREFLVAVAPVLERAIGFAADAGDQIDPSLLPKPIESVELLSIIRNPGRAPLLRKRVREQHQRRARTLALASASHGDGATMTALNLASELTLLEKKVLLIDAHHHQPAVSILLGERNINQARPKSITSNLSIFEVTKENASNVEEILYEFSLIVDFIVVDLGNCSISHYGEIERRWEAILNNLLLDSIDDLWILSSSSKISIASLNMVTASLEQSPQRIRTTHILNRRQSGKAGEREEERFLSMVTPGRPHGVRVLPLDLRGVERAEADRSLLMETNLRGLLRRELAAIAQELAGKAAP